MTRNMVAFFLTLLMVFSFAACASQPAATATPAEPKAEVPEKPVEPEKPAETAKPAESEKIVVEIAHMFAEGDPTYIAVEEGKAHIEELSNGRITMTIYPNGIFGEQANSIQAVRMGSLDVFCEGFSSNYVKRAGAIQGPFLFEDYAAWDKFKKSEYCAQLISEIEQAAGYHVMGLGHFGFRQFLGTSEAKTVADFSKLKMRVVDSPAYRAVATVLGATGTPINIADVYLSLQSNVVQATENPLGQLVSMKFYEVAKYLHVTNHMIAQQYWIASNKFYDGLSTEDQKLVDDTFDFIAARIEELVVENEQKYIDTMKASGVKVIDDLDKQQFVDRLDLVFKEFPEWKEVYDNVQK